MEIESQRIHEIGNIDLGIYKCIADGIVNSKVIITEKQLHHTCSKHPETESINVLMLEKALTDPDYIIRDKKNNDTGLVIKRLIDNNLIIVLKVITNRNINLSNSVISSWVISDKRLESYLRNREVLYRKLE